ncbi:WecB/TagA/CpsF family glycosyltransferase [Allocoleopsis sp.]|uniref:WecB/TagA/CpsF family glycosyltransferase n=1 Tax=Allocoleopsis sp. TaxID=3088169 RepID=UPI002FD44E0F
MTTTTVRPTDISADFSKVEMLPSLNVHLLSRRITCMPVPAIVEAIHRACVQERKITVANYNVHSFNLSMLLPWFYNFLQSAEITHCDSTGILKALEFMGLKLPLDYRASYTALMPELLKHCNKQGFSIFLLGSKPEYLEAALDKLRSKYPNIRSDGHHGYFDIENLEQNEAVIQKINRANPNILIVGMGMPLQENWIRLHRSRLNVNVIMPGGAVIDRLAGIVSDCPAFLSQWGLEWLYRLCREPKRLAVRYLLGNPAFVLLLALAKFYASPLEVEEQPNPSRHQQRFLAIVHPDDQHLGRYLVEAGLLTPSQLKTALSEQKVSGLRLGELIVRKKWLKQQTVEFLMEKLLIRKQVVVQTDDKRLGHYLVEAGLLSPSQVETALSEQNKTGLRLGELIVKKGWIKEQTIEFLIKDVILSERVLCA